MNLFIVTLTMAVAGASAESGNPCAEWFAADTANVCPEGALQRDADDGHGWNEEDSSIDITGECCYSRCADVFTGTCPTGEAQRSSNVWGAWNKEAADIADHCCAVTCVSAATATCADGEMLRNEECWRWDDGEQVNMCDQVGEGNDFEGCCEKASCMNDPSNEGYIEECTVDDWFNDVCGSGTETCETLCDLGEDTFTQVALQACADCATEHDPLCFGCLTCMLDHHGVNETFGPFTLVDKSLTRGPTPSPTSTSTNLEFSGADKAAAASGSVLLLSAVLTAML